MLDFGRWPCQLYKSSSIVLSAAVSGAAVSFVVLQSFQLAAAKA